MPLQHRHTYAADLRCGLRAGEKDTDRRSHPSAGADKCALLSRPASPRLEPVHSIERLSDAGSSRTPSRFACRARTVWECRPASSLSGLLPTLPCTLQDQAALSFTGLLRQARGGALSSPPGLMAPRGAPSRPHRAPQPAPAGSRQSEPAAPTVWSQHASEVQWTGEKPPEPAAVVPLTVGAMTVWSCGHEAEPVASSGSRSDASVGAVPRLWQPCHRRPVRRRTARRFLRQLALTCASKEAQRGVR